MSTFAEVPSLIPARMVNEASYCSRLFYLEWVQGRFMESADTVEGSFLHRRVDTASGEVAEPTELGRPTRATSVAMSSERLGLTCTIDLLHADSGWAVPVDYKKGKVPQTADRAWEPERVQLCVQGLILRDNGFQCDHGVLWFAASRQSVDVHLTDGLVERTLAVVAEMRRLSRVVEVPAPLVNSPKCPRCSLVGLCLPDEHNMLAERSPRAARRLIPTDAAARPLYVTEPGAVVGVNGGRLEVQGRQRKLASVRAMDVSQICTFGNVQVTTQALRACFEVGIGVCFLSGGGWLQGVASGMPSKHIELRRRQFASSEAANLGFSRAFVQGKVRNARTLLRRNGRPAPEDAVKVLSDGLSRISSVQSVGSLLGCEGAAARTYFQAFSTMLKIDASLPGLPFGFDGRNRRPPRDAVNALLSFVYALLVKDLVSVCISVGFDPYLGFYHRPRFGRPALALDLAEEFRPLVGDSTVITVINNGVTG